MKAYGTGKTLRQMLAGLDRSGPWEAELCQLEKEAQAGRKYLEGLRQETIRLGLLAEEGMEGHVLRSIVDKLEGEELEALRTCYEKRLEKSMALPTQLRYGGGQTGPAGDDGAFAI